MNSFKNIFIFSLYKLTGLVSIAMSSRCKLRIGKLFGSFMRIISPKRKDITLDNLRNAFPEKSENEIRNIMIESYHNLGIVFIEVAGYQFLSDEKLMSQIYYENPELINELHAKGKGLILLSGHFGNWELLAYSASLYSQLPVMIVVKPQKNKEIDTIINKFRTRNKNTIVSMYSAARTIVSNLKSGGILALLVDQSANEEKDIFVNFFGRPADTYEAPAALSLRFGSPIIMGFAVRNKDGKYSVRLEEIKSDDLESSQEGIKILTERHVKKLENEIRKRPELWAWQHRRWKHSPKSYQHEK